MPVFWTISGVTLALLLADYAYRRYASGRIRNIVENVPTFAAIPTSSIPNLKTFRVCTNDGIELEACLHLPDKQPSAVVLFCPELNGNHWTALHYARGLVDGGIAVLAFDFRNQGNSDHQKNYAPIHWVTEFELTDIEAMLRHIDGAPDLQRLPIGIYGISRGGSAALQAACRFPQISAVVTESAYAAMPLIRSFMNKFSRFVVPDWFFNRLPAWHIELVLRQALSRSEGFRNCRYTHLDREAANYTKPTLLISGSRDSYVTPGVTNEIAAILSLDEQSWLVPKAKHNKAREKNPDKYDQVLLSHFRNNLNIVIPAPAPVQSQTRVA